MKEALKFDITQVIYYLVCWIYWRISCVFIFINKQNGLLSSMPYATALVVHMIAGKVFDCCRKKQFCSLTVLRKIFNTIGGQP